MFEQYIGRTSGNEKGGMFAGCFSGFFSFSLRSKRFRRVFSRPFEAFFAFRRRKNWGERNTDGSSVSSRTFLGSPQFSRVYEAKNASNLRKALRKRLLRRLLFFQIFFRTLVALNSFNCIFMGKSYSFFLNFVEIF